jgi:plastocyanin
MKHFRLPVAVMLALLTACGGDGGTTSPPQTVKTLGSISVTTPTLSVAAGSFATLTANALDAQSAALSGVTYSYASSNVSAAEVSADGSVLGLGAGTSTITVTGTLSGVTKTATAVVTVTGTLPANASVAGGVGAFTFTPATVVIARGGSVAWSWGATPHNVTFAGTVGAPAPIPSGTAVAASRAFATPGNFDYQCTIHAGMSGKVVVR